MYTIGNYEWEAEWPNEWSWFDGGYSEQALMMAGFSFKTATPVMTEKGLAFEWQQQLGALMRDGTMPRYRQVLGGLDPLFEAVTLANLKK